MGFDESTDAPAEARGGPQAPFGGDEGGASAPLGAPAGPDGGALAAVREEAARCAALRYAALATRHALRRPEMERRVGDVLNTAATPLNLLAKFKEVTLTGGGGRGRGWAVMDYPFFSNGRGAARIYFRSFAIRPSGALSRRHCVM